MDLQGPSLQPGLPPPGARLSSDPRLLPRPALGSRPPQGAAGLLGFPAPLGHDWPMGRGSGGGLPALHRAALSGRSEGQEQDRGVPARPAPGSPPLAAALPPPGPPSRAVWAVVASTSEPSPPPLLGHWLPWGRDAWGGRGGWAHGREAAAGAACGCSPSAETSPERVLLPPSFKSVSAR